MKKKGAVVATLMIGLLFTVATLIKSTHGLQCASCVYFKVGDMEMGDVDCKYGKSLPVEECSENYVIPATALTRGAQQVRLGDVRQILLMSNRDLTEDKTHYACERSEAVARVSGQPFSMMSRGCTINPEKKQMCKTGSKEELGMLGNMVPAGAEAKIEHFEVCACFEDQCNSGVKLGGGGGNLAWKNIFSVLTVAIITLMKNVNF